MHELSVYSTQCLMNLEVSILAGRGRCSFPSCVSSRNYIPLSQVVLFLAWVVLLTHILITFIWVLEGDHLELSKFVLFAILCFLVLFLFYSSHLGLPGLSALSSSLWESTRLPLGSFSLHCGLESLSRQKSGDSCRAYRLCFQFHMIIYCLMSSVWQTTVSYLLSGFCLFLVERNSGFHYTIMARA